MSLPISLNSPTPPLLLHLPQVPPPQYPPRDLRLQLILVRPEELLHHQRRVAMLKVNEGERGVQAMAPSLCGATVGFEVLEECGTDA